MTDLPDLDPEDQKELDEIHALVKARDEQMKNDFLSKYLGYDVDDIKSMADDVAEELYQSMIDGRLPNFSTHASRPRTTISAQDYNKLVRGRFSNQYLGISPTDNQARGKYEYQEPEVDEQGTYYGYKVLCVDRNYRGHATFRSPRYSAYWRSDGEIEADREPTVKSMYGIHCTKRPDHPELGQYYRPFAGAIYPEPTSVLVKCALSGTIVETEQGFRAQHAQIIGVYQDGYWRSYQDYQECASPRPCRIAEDWEEDETWRFRYTAGRSFNSYFDPSADS